MKRFDYDTVLAIASVTYTATLLLVAIIVLTFTNQIMTKKDFEFTAALIDAARKGVHPDHLTSLAAAHFIKANPRFDEMRFRAACDTAPPPVHAPDGDLGPLWWHKKLCQRGAAYPRPFMKKKTPPLFQNGRGGMKKSLPES